MAIHTSSSTITPSVSQFLSTPPFQSPQYPSCQSLLSPTTLRSLNFSPNRNNLTAAVPKASSTATFSPEVTDVLAGVDIFTASGDPVLFNELWDQSEGIAVVALLRHFGCPCCWELASTLKESKARFESMGVKLIAIGIGEPKKARILAERLPFPLDSLYADPERKAYNHLGLYYGIGRTFFNPASVIFCFLSLLETTYIPAYMLNNRLNRQAKVLSRSRFETLRKAVKNYTIEATPDDRASVLQQGGMLVFKGKELLYAWKDEGTGDHAPLDDVFSVCYNASAA
ncbi:hypothetical protein E3N88_20372 [Mikania micrantha]|uniref:Thioredoxin domain-containing protein n=1 Tax=Mikania micrantha TaxID=192012 RepID=A0A5N6NHZ8_9ASTR|nr:hypothetical protein E3N88_20372 [Mikania micrantha]